MSKEYDIDIDNFVGTWNNSKYTVKKILAAKPGVEVLVRVNSFGGSLDNGIDIAAQFEAHGNVTCDLYSLVASAATILTLGAKHIRMHCNSAYLIHKPLSWVESWGWMNDDDLAQTIEKLSQEKDRASTVALLTAKMYARKSGRKTSEILSLMKNERWLTAEEAKEMGFVDEIFTNSKIISPKPDPNIDNFIGGQVARLVACAGLPPLPESLNLNNRVTMNKIFTSLNECLDIEGIEFIDGKATLTEEQIRIINLTLAATAVLTGSTPATVPAAASVPAADTSATDPDATDPDLYATIAQLQARIAALEKLPGAETNPVSSATDTASAEQPGSVFERARALMDSLPD
jgi:ATP-dependent protease ClpP protease subunit